jgi:hypothetical protein
VGALVTAVLTILLGAGPIALIVTTPRDEGANIGGGILATLAVLLAVGLGSSFTARRAVRRAGSPMVEGLTASVGALLVLIVAGDLVLVVAGVVSPAALQGVLDGMLSVGVPALGAAFVGATVGAGSARRRSG